MNMVKSICTMVTVKWRTVFLTRHTSKGRLMGLRIAEKLLSSPQPLDHLLVQLTDEILWLDKRDVRHDVNAWPSHLSTLDLIHLAHACSSPHDRIIRVPTLHILCKPCT